MSQFWDKTELDNLKKHYSTATKKEITKILPRHTFAAIQRMASSLRIRKMERDFVLTPEISANISRAHLGHKLSESHRAALRRCTLNESAFDLLNEESEYWLGFLHTDGNVCYKEGRPVIALHLKHTDISHLQKFRNFVGSSHKIGTYVNKIWGNTSHSLSFRSEKMADTLAKYGLVPRKCFVAEIKGGVENSRHVWRGVIDGDGCVGTYRRKNLNGSIRKVPYLSLTGSKIVCLQFRAFLEKELGEPMPPNIVFYKKSYLIMVSDQRAVKAIKLLYNNCTIALERKLRRAIDIIAEFEPS